MKPKPILARLLSPLMRSTPKVRRVITVCLTDTHGGHQLGLLIPGTEVFDTDERGNLYPRRATLTRTQSYLHRTLVADLAVAKQIADGDEIILVHGGDVTHGNTYPEQLVSTRLADQILIGAANLSFIIDQLRPNITKLRLVRGTNSHIFGEGSAPILITRQLQSDHPDLDIGFSNHYLLDIEGKTIDVAHKGPSPGSRRWLKGNMLRYYTVDIMLGCLVDGEKPPDALVRGHFHEFCHETVRQTNKRGVYQTEAIILPSYCGLSDHGREATRSTSHVGNGLVVFEILPDRLTPIYEKTIHITDVRTKEVL